MRLKKATKFCNEILVGISRGHEVSIWQYPNQVYIEIDGLAVVVSRKQLKAFLTKDPSK